MSQFIGQQAPDFEAVAVMPDGTFKEGFKLSDYKGKHVVLFFYPLDFTFVCPTEIIEFSKKVAEFEKRGVQVIGVSIDSQFSHYTAQTRLRFHSAGAAEDAEEALALADEGETFYPPHRNRRFLALYYRTVRNAACTRYVD